MSSCPAKLLTRLAHTRKSTTFRRGKASQMPSLSHQPLSSSNLRLYSDSAASSLKPTYRAWCLPAELGKYVRLGVDNHFEESKRVDLHALRDACECIDCIDLMTGQKKFSSTQIPDVLYTKQTKVTNGCLHIEWENDFRSPGQSHHSRYPYVQQLYEGKMLARDEFHLPPRILWDKKMLEKFVARIPYKAWMQSADELAKGLLSLHHFGIAIIEGGPRHDMTIEHVVNRIGNLHETFLGRTFDDIHQVGCEQRDLEQDMLFMTYGNIPRIKAMYCYENDVDGGENIFADGVRAARQFFTSDPENFREFAKTTLRFRYKADGYNFGASHPVCGNLFRTVKWAPSLQHPCQQLNIRAGMDSRRYWALARTFVGFLQEKQRMGSFKLKHALFSYKLQPGDCVLLDNLRIPHGQTAFRVNPGGMRWFKGAYITDDVYTSKLRGVIDRSFPEMFKAAWRSEADQAKASFGIRSAEERSVWKLRERLRRAELQLESKQAEDVFLELKLNGRPES